MKRIWRDYSLGIVYLGIWLLSLALHVHGEWWASQYPHDAVPWGIEWWVHFWENIQSEYHQVGAFVLLSKYLIFRGSGQSKDGDDRMEAKIDTLLGRVDEMQRRQQHLPPLDDGKGKKR